jgi:tRNA(Ile)-lysidine synthase
VKEFLQHLETAIGRRHLLERGQRVLVAVSGGADSMVLLQALHSLGRTHGWKISVAHFNHRLRGQASNADARLVRAAAAKLGVACFAGEGNVKTIAAGAKLSIEMTARKLRHEFLARTAREHGISTVALAHHADDQVESFFLRLFRGSGSEGLAGMKWRSSSPADKTVLLVRPLLNFSKADLLEYARAEKIRFREDATNLSNDFMRNRIRNELLPLLRKEYQPGIDKTVLRLMDIIGAESDFVARAAQEIIVGRGRAGSAMVGDFNGLPLALQRRILQHELTSAGLVPDYELIEQLRRLPGKAVSVGVGLSVTRDEAGRVTCREHTSGEFKAGQISAKLTGGQGNIDFNGRSFRWAVKPAKKFQQPPKRKLAGPSAVRETFDAEPVGDEIVLRHWQPGDRFQPIGMKSSSKLQDLFVNAKIPAARRRELVLATTAAGEIFWVEGLRIGENVKITNRTAQMLIWQIY